MSHDRPKEPTLRIHREYAERVRQERERPAEARATEHPDELCARRKLQVIEPEYAAIMALLTDESMSAVEQIEALKKRVDEGAGLEKMARDIAYTTALTRGNVLESVQSHMGLLADRALLQAWGEALHEKKKALGESLRKPASVDAMHAAHAACEAVDPIQKQVEERALALARGGR